MVFNENPNDGQDKTPNKASVFFSASSFASFFALDPTSSPLISLPISRSSLTFFCLSLLPLFALIFSLSCLFLFLLLVLALPYFCFSLFLLFVLALPFFLLHLKIFPLLALVLLNTHFF